jgi:phage shock protein PspC (stress-responsive transcriptional regulator)
MNKVTAINLNGNAYQLEESGYEALRNYLENAGRRLEGNPDRDEIVADIEQAIADKFRALLGPHKTVVVAQEVERIIAEMGPVQDASGEPEEPPDRGTAGAASGSARRLYKIREGAMIGGVCNGVAAYFNIDVSIVRILFAVLAVMWGFGVLLYILMLIVIPAANTSAEKAAAAGGGPSTAEEFIRRAKEGYYEGMKTFKDKRAHREWKRKFKQEMRGWKKDFQREMRDNGDRWRRNWHQTWGHPPGFECGLSGPFLFLAFFNVLVTLLGIYAVWSLLVRGAVFGAHPPGGVPLWLSLLGLLMIWRVLTFPFRAHHHPCYGRGAGFGDSFAWVAFVVLVVWLANRHVPRFHEALQNLRPACHQALDSLRQVLDKL